MKKAKTKLSMKELEKRTDILMSEILVLQEMVDMLGNNLISYIRFRKNEKKFMKYIESSKEGKSSRIKKKQSNQEYPTVQQVID